MHEAWALLQFAFVEVVAIGVFALLIAKTRIIEKVEEQQECEQNDEKMLTT